MDVKVGQTWRDDTGYLYLIVAITKDSVWARHPNCKPGRGSRQIHPSWFKEPTWELVRDTPASTVAL